MNNAPAPFQSASLYVGDLNNEVDFLHVSVLIKSFSLPLFVLWLQQLFNDIHSYANTLSFLNAFLSIGHRRSLV